MNTVLILKRRQKYNYNMDEELQKKFEEQNAKLEEIYKVTKQTRNYFRLTFIVSVVLIVLPLIGLLFALPAIMGSIGSSIPSVLQ